MLNKREYNEIANSEDEIDKLLVYINNLSPHNLWQAYSVIKEKLKDKI